MQSSLEPGPELVRVTLSCALIKVIDLKQRSCTNDHQAVCTVTVKNMAGLFLNNYEVFGCVEISISELLAKVESSDVGECHQINSAYYEISIFGH